MDKEAIALKNMKQREKQYNTQKDYYEKNKDKIALKKKEYNTKNKKYESDKQIKMIENKNANALKCEEAKKKYLLMKEVMGWN